MDLHARARHEAAVTRAYFQYLNWDKEYIPVIILRNLRMDFMEMDRFRGEVLHYLIVEKNAKSS